MSVRRLATAALLAATALGLPVPAHAAKTLDDTSVTVTVLDINPMSPVVSETPRPVDFSLALVNNTDEEIRDLSVVGFRRAPISEQAVLDETIAEPADGEGGLPLQEMEVAGTLAPRGSVTISYRALAGLPNDEGLLCQCHHGGIYPLSFHVRADAGDQGRINVGYARTFVPTFQSAPAPVRVSWVWPILDRPHRTTGDTVFIDDGLASSVAGGRLDRVLEVLERTPATVRLTVLLDPELVDELAVMSAGYTVRSGTTTQPGTGGNAAAAWLRRLKAVLPKHDVNLSPPADPDVDALTRAGLPWHARPGSQSWSRVLDALGTALPSEVAWPAEQTLSAEGLAAVARTGASAVLLDDATITGGRERSPRPDALAPLPEESGNATAVVVPQYLQRQVADVVSIGGRGLTALPELVAQVAIRSAVDPSSARYVALIPPRYVDPSPATVRAIAETATPYWASPITVREAVGTVTPVDQGGLTPGPLVGISQLNLDVIREANAFLGSFVSMLAPADAAALLAGLPATVQRVASAAWRTDGTAGAAFAEALRKEMATLGTGVRIERPIDGQYTLASGDGRLPVTVVNTLGYDVEVRVRITSRLPGLSAADTGVEAVPARSRRTVQIPAQVARSGRFSVEAQLLTPDRAPLGDPVTVTVHSTALGRIGVLITVGAGVVLTVLLGFRGVRGLHRMRKNRAAA